MEFSKRLAAMTLAAATIFLQATNASATTVTDFLKEDAHAQYDLYKKVVQIRLDQLRVVDPKSAEKLTDFFFKSSEPGKDSPGYEQFKVYVQAVEHPEISGLNYNPDTAQVEGVLTTMIVGDYDKLRGSQVATATASHNTLPAPGNR